MNREIVLSTEDTNKAKKFAEDLVGNKFQLWSSRDRHLTEEKAKENIYRGKCGEIAVYNYLTENGYTLAPVDFEIRKNQKHDADLVVIGTGINIHVKTCLKNFCSWIFQHDAPYILEPTSRDFNCLVQQMDFDVYRIRSLRHTGSYVYEKTLKYMPTKICIYENTL